MKSKNPIYYVIDRKGSFFFVDTLEVNQKEKKAVLVNDSIPSATFGVTEIKLRRPAFERKVAFLVKKGYAITEIDGAEDRMPKEEALKALNLEFNKEKITILSYRRAEIYPYFDLKILKNAVDAYVDGQILDIYINFWAIFYSRCLQESYHQDDTDKMTEVFIESVCAQLEDFGTVLSLKTPRDEKFKTIRQIYNEIAQSYKIYQRQHERFLKKKSKRHVHKKSKSRRKEILTKGLPNN